MSDQHNNHQTLSKDLKCIANCGFFGATDYHGYCSKCYRLQKKKEHLIQRSKSDEPAIRTYVRTGPCLDRKSDDKYKNKVQISNPEKFRHYKQQEIQYMEMLDFINLPKSARSDLKVALQMLDGNIQIKQSLSADIDEISKIIQQGYAQFMELMSDEHSNFTYANQDLKEEIMEVFEKCIMSKDYHKLFSPEKDISEDIEIKKCFQQLRWVCPAKNLDFPIDVYNPQVRRLIYAAISELDSLDALMLPEDKMDAIRRCCIIIQEFIKQHTGHGLASADSMMPAMIFVVLQAHPLHIYSNINYITRFRNENKVHRGEAAYYFTTLCAAVNIIQTSTAETFEVDANEFEKQISGQKQYTTPWNLAVSATHSFFLLGEFKKIMPSMINQSQDIILEMENLKEDMKKFKQDIQSKVTDVLERTPLVLRRIKNPCRSQKQDEPLSATSSVRADSGTASVFAKPQTRSVRGKRTKEKTRKNFLSITPTIDKLIASLSSGFSEATTSSSIVTDGEKPPGYESSNLNVCGIEVILSPPESSDSSSDDEDEDDSDVSNYVVKSSDNEDPFETNHHLFTPRSKTNDNLESVSKTNDNLVSVSPLSVSPIFDYRSSGASYSRDEIYTQADYIEFLCRPCLEGENPKNSKFCEPDEIIEIF